MQVKGDLIADLTEDLAAEQKARVTYDNLLRLSDDPDVSDVLRFLRAREIVHFQRFGDTNHNNLSGFCCRMDIGASCPDVRFVGFCRLQSIKFTDGTCLSFTDVIYCPSKECGAT